MSITAGVVNLPVRPDLSGFGAAITTQSSGIFRSVGGGLSALSKTLIALPIAGAIVAGIGGAVSTLGDWVQQAADAEAVGKGLKNTLHEMGNVAGVTADKLLLQNQQFGIMTGLDDDLITEGTNLLATFKDINDVQGQGNDIFTQANALMADYAVQFTDGNFETAAVQLGKALNDPISGMGTLARVGVTFSAQEKEVITSLVESNHLLEAQKLILKSITPQVKGYARAHSTAIDRLTNAWGEFTEFLGAAILPHIKPIFNILTSFVRQATRDPKHITEAWQRAWTKIKQWFFTDMWPAITDFWEDRVIPALKLAWAGMLNFMKNEFMKMLASLAQSLSNFLPGSGGGPGIPDIPFQIPHFAQGGVVTRPTVAMVGEKGPELITPLKRGRVHVILDNPHDVGDGGAAAAHMQRMARLQRS